MTKAEYLQSLRPRERDMECKEYAPLLYTWCALGANDILEGTAYFTEGIIYRVGFGDKINFLLYCKQSHSEKHDWNKLAPLGRDSSDSNDYGEVTFGNSIISPDFDILLYPPEFSMLAKFYGCMDSSGAIINRMPEGAKSFVPFQELDKMNSDGGHVIISEKDYERCISCLGYPFVQEDELEYDRDTILDMAIKPALERYFKYFPKTEIVTYPVTGMMQDELFPTGAYDVIHFSVQQGRPTSSYSDDPEENEKLEKMGITNPLLRYWDEAMFTGGLGAGLTGTYHGTYAPKTQINTSGTFISGRAAQQAVVNYRTRYHMDKYQDRDGKWHIRFHSNKMGLAEVHYAMQTCNFGDTEFARRPELYKLCNAEVKKLFGNLRRQIKSDLPGVVNYGDWVTEADREIEEVETNWRSIVKYSSIIRGSL